MSGLTASGQASQRRTTNAALFFRRWLANPLQMGSVIPSSPSLCKRIAVNPDMPVSLTTTSPPGQPGSTPP